MPRRRAAQGGKKPARKPMNQTRLRSLVPRVGFKFVGRDSRARKILQGLESEVIKEAIRSSSSSQGLNKAMVDQALAMVFEKATEALSQEGNGDDNDNDDDDDAAMPDADAAADAEGPAPIPKIADVQQAEFWKAVCASVPWARDLSGWTMFQLAVALMAAHAAYEAEKPYERFKHQYGRLAESVRAFAGQFRERCGGGDNWLLKSLYEVDVALDSDYDAGDEREEDEDETETAKGRRRGRGGDDGDDENGEGSGAAAVIGAKRGREEDDAGLEFGVKRRETGLGDWAYAEEEANLAGHLRDVQIDEE
ncbi:hypothetical protein GGR56DRAFT_697682 [Xylariaceae sp. FL0804]|nr:hypothetical protein GGR56DRAFT_697682 [Xylariaceae sp. FL0804]